MKWMAFVIGLMGTVIGAITVHLETGDFFHGIHTGSPVWTTIAISIGCLGSVLLLWRERLAAFILLAIAIAGVFGNYTMWEGPGTFFLASAFIAFTNPTRTRERASDTLVTARTSGTSAKP